MNTIDTPRRPVAVLLALVLTGAPLAACGSSSSTSSSAGSTSSTKTTAATGSGANAARRAALRTCLAKHGVTLPTRRPGAGPPAGGGAGRGAGAGGGLFGGGGGADRPGANPKFAAALRACGGAAGFGGGARRFQLSPAAVTKFVTCVRQHGFNMPNPNFSGGPVFSASIRSNPKFVTASKPCASLLVRPRAGAGGSPPTA